jgi:RNA polymerase primary sigma factor
MLGPRRERQLLEKLADARRTLTEALTRGRAPSAAERTDDPREVSRLIAEAHRRLGPPDGAGAAAFRRYFELRAQLALANVRLVAHVAKQYRDRGIAYSDLLQEGFCGLLEAIDRFDLAHQTKLSTYATWWIRQSVQSAVASGAYPVRLTPRHLRQLGRYEEGHEGGLPQAADRHRVPAESLQRIRSATRPVVPLDEARIGRFPIVSDPSIDRAEFNERREALGRWLESLRPRERQVVSYRFGLGGMPQLSLRQVGEVLNVSKERVRQIQDAALKRLRSTAAPDNLTPTC